MTKTKLEAGQIWLNPSDTCIRKIYEIENDTVYYRYRYKGIDDYTSSVTIHRFITEYAGTLLTKFEFPKPKEKRRLQGWLNVYPDNKIGVRHNSKEDANTSAGDSRIACVYIDQEYEVDVIG